MARKSPASAGPTINDLAQHLGVHKSTVSRAMDPARRHLIGADLLQRVETAARELGWRPNRAAAALSTGRSRTVGVLLPDITNPVFPPILRGIEDALDTEGYFALLANTSRRDGGQAAAQAAVERMLAQRVEGFIVATALRDDAWLESLRVGGARVVLVNRTDGRGLLPAVTSDDMLGMRLAVDHLVALGHRRVAHLAGPAFFSTGQARRVGFEQALREQGLQPAGIATCGAYSIEAGASGMRELLALRPRARSGGFTAVVAANDLIALGALQVLQAKGIEVPQDVSLIGHNDMPLLDQLRPPLTSVRIQHYEMGLRAARLLMAALHGTPDAASTVVLRPELMVRGSTAVAPGRS
jgi:LacI family transcriptional regulator